ncbi:hypothetical protein [Bifidobacterium pseudolongum]|uniref:hypothetical protein n=1 Tax=Bifidobacterium pseudolongum TaxID=1694 RepID=UPI00209D048E|nr:hypothetical protein [Bifidobacterium pseudolongum]
MDDSMNTKVEGQDDGTRQRLSDEAAKRRIEASDAKNELAAAQAELNATRLTLARLTAQREHPQITDEMFDKLCHATTPEGVEAWAEAWEELVAPIIDADPRITEEQKRYEEYVAYEERNAAAFRERMQKFRASGECLIK